MAEKMDESIGISTNTNNKVASLDRFRGLKVLQESEGVQKHVENLLNGDILTVFNRQISDSLQVKADLEGIFQRYGIEFKKEDLDYLISEEYKDILAISAFESNTKTDEPLRLGPNEGSDENRLTIIDGLNLGKNFSINFLYYKPKENVFEVESVSINMDLKEYQSISEVKKSVEIIEEIEIELRNAGFKINVEMSNFGYIDLQIRQNLSKTDLDKLLGIITEHKI